MSSQFILLLLATHFVADFLLQSDWMALNKGKRWDALGSHVFVYALTFFVVLASWKPMPPGFSIVFALVTFGAHFVQDAITARINGRFWFFDMAMPVYYPSRRNPNGPSVPHYAATVGDRHWFFVGIGADQLLHFVQLIATAEWLLR